MRSASGKKREKRGEKPKLKNYPNIINNNSDKKKKPNKTKSTPVYNKNIFMPILRY